MDPGLRTRLVKWSAWLVVAAVLILALPTLVLTAAPVGCTACHTPPDLTVADASAHATVSCVSCHIGEGIGERVSFAFSQSFGMLVPILPVSDGPAGQVRDEACESCHAEFEPVTESRGLRFDHQSCVESADCVSCHAGVPHLDSVSWPKTYSMEACLECHSTRQVSRDCESCHTGKSDGLIPTTGVFPVTHGANWRSTHGMGEMSTCSACHVDDDFCSDCHGPGVPHEPHFTSLHGLVALDAAAQCETCHNESFCTGCHVYEMPHPQDFASEHSRVSASDGRENCLKCHDEYDCVQCHEMHVHPGGATPRGTTARGDGE